MTPARGDSAVILLTRIVSTYARGMAREGSRNDGREATNSIRFSRFDPRVLNGNTSPLGIVDVSLDSSGPRPILSLSLSLNCARHARENEIKISFLSLSLSLSLCSGRAFALLEISPARYSEFRSERREIFTRRRAPLPRLKCDFMKSRRGPCARAIEWSLGGLLRTSESRNKPLRAARGNGAARRSTDTADTAI